MLSGGKGGGCILTRRGYGSVFWVEGRVTSLFRSCIVQGGNTTVNLQDQVTAVHIVVLDNSKHDDDTSWAGQHELFCWNPTSSRLFCTFELKN